VSDGERIQLENDGLRRRLADSEEAVRALSSDESDAVAEEAGGSPVRWRSAQAKLYESVRLLRAVPCPRVGI
jgi:hypothetical protein